MVSKKSIAIKFANEEHSKTILELEEKWKNEKIDKDMNPYNIEEINKAIKEKRIIIAEYNNKIIGFLFFEIKNEICELDALYIKKEYRNFGIGDSMMKFFLKIEQVMSCSKIYLLADSIYEDKLIKFYEKFGFKKAAVKMVRKNFL